MLAEKEKDRTTLTNLQAKNKQLELQNEKNKLKLEASSTKKESSSAQDIEKVLQPILEQITDETEGLLL